jgi:hypothetical protein
VLGENDLREQFDLPDCFEQLDHVEAFLKFPLALPELRLLVCQILSLARDELLEHQDDKLPHREHKRL